MKKPACPLSPRETALRGSQDEREGEARVNPDLPSLTEEEEKEKFYFALGAKSLQTYDEMAHGTCMLHKEIDANAMAVSKQGAITSTQLDSNCE